MDVSNLPIRSNGDNIVNAWFNSIRTFISTIESFVDQVDATIGNTVSPAEDVTGITLDSSLYTSAIYEVEVSRATDSVDAFSTGRISLQFVAGAWRVESGGFLGDADTSPGGGGITFSVTESLGVAQLQYVSSTIAGASYVGTIKLRRVVFNV